MDGDDGAQPGRCVAAEDHLLVGIEIPHLKEVHRSGSTSTGKVLHDTRRTLHGASQRLLFGAPR